MKLRALIAIPVFATLLAIEGCRYSSVGEALKDFRGPRYAQSMEVGSHVVEIRYLPKSFRILHGFKRDDSTPLTHALFDSLTRSAGEVEGIMFLMRLGPRDSSPRRDFANDVIYGRLSGYETFQEAQRTYSFELKGLIWLEVDGKKIPLASYQMENSFGMSPSRYFILSFPNLEGMNFENKKRVKLVLDDIVPGLARQKFTWTLPVGKYDDAI